MPELKGLLKEVDFLCACCSSNNRQPTYYTLEQSADNGALEAISAPRNVPSKDGRGIPYATRFAVFCPVCRTTPEDTEHPGFMKGIVDLKILADFYGPNWKRPKRPMVMASAGVGEDDEDEAPADSRTEKLKKKTGKSGAVKKPRKAVNPADHAS
jgi:hypothetical protein